MADKIKVRVGFDHAGDDGEQRRAGDEVTIGYDEYLRRGPNGDGFLRDIATRRRGKAAEPGDATDPVRDLPQGASVPSTDPTTPTAPAKRAAKTAGK